VVGIERKMINISKENYDKLSQLAKERGLSFDKMIGTILQEIKTGKRITDNWGFINLKLEDIKRMIDSGAEPKDKVRKIEQYINECYIDYVDA
jgi:predicted CopG family antitoxin